MPFNKQKSPNGLIGGTVVLQELLLRFRRNQLRSRV
jgi:hypothetical protein